MVATEEKSVENLEKSKKDENNEIVKCKLKNRIKFDNRYEFIVICKIFQIFFKRCEMRRTIAI